MNVFIKLSICLLIGVTPRAFALSPPALGNTSAIPLKQHMQEQALFQKVLKIHSIQKLSSSGNRSVYIGYDHQNQPLVILKSNQSFSSFHEAVAYQISAQVGLSVVPPNIIAQEMPSKIYDFLSAKFKEQIQQLDISTYLVEEFLTGQTPQPPFNLIVSLSRSKKPENFSQDDWEHLLGRPLTRINPQSAHQVLLFNMLLGMQDVSWQQPENSFFVQQNQQWNIYDIDIEQIGLEKTDSWLLYTPFAQTLLPIQEIQKMLGTHFIQIIQDAFRDFSTKYPSYGEFNEFTEAPNQILKRAFALQTILDTHTGEISLSDLHRQINTLAKSA